MPELPEVETTIRALRKKVVGAIFTNVWCDTLSIIKNPFSEFQKKIKGKEIKQIRRIGKNIIFDLSNHSILLVHQKMTGHLLYGKWKKDKKGWVSTKALQDPINRFLHILFFLDTGYQLALSDMRKFAKVEFLEQIDLTIGEDALAISLNNFKKKVKRKKGIKTILMDQSILAGIGNIYSDEVLFEAKVHPLKQGNSLTEKELQRIYQAMKKVLKKAIIEKGTSFSDYRTPDGTKGGFLKFIKVYHKKECPICLGQIKKVKIGSRTAHFCDKCQKL